jgi:uncharacterized protein with PIN domain
MNPSEVSFAADRMLGRLARMLRLLGYDTEYSPEMTTAQLQAMARREDRKILTRGQAAKRFPNLTHVFSVKSEHAPEQLREVVSQFKLDVHSGLWTRCTLCNGVIERAEKTAVAGLVPAKVLEVYEEFYRCTRCSHIYWRGSHVARVTRNLAALLGTEPDLPSQ